MPNYFAASLRKNPNCKFPVSLYIGGNLAKYFYEEANSSYIINNGSINRVRYYQT